MNRDELRAIFDEAISKTNDRTKRAQLSVVREYLTNPDFKSKLEAFVFEKTRKEIAR